MNKRSIVVITIALIVSSSLLHGADAEEMYKQAANHLIKEKNINSPADLKKPDVIKALEIFSEIIRAWPETKWAELSRKHMAYTYWRAKDYNNAQTVFSEMVEIYSNYDSVSDWKYILGKIDYELRKYNDAEEKFKNLIDDEQVGLKRAMASGKPINKNKIARAKLMLGKGKLHQKQYKEAEEEFYSIVSDYSESPYAGDAIAEISRAYYKQGYALANEEKYSQAIEYFNKAIELYNNEKRQHSLLHKIFPETYFIKAETYIKLGDKEKAKELYEEITKEFYGKYKYKEAKDRLIELKE